MPRQRSNASTTDRASRRIRSDTKDALLGAGPEQLRRLGKVLGNDALANKMELNDRVRDVLLAFLTERLQALEAAQKAERRALRNRSEWFRRVMRGEKGVALPEPQRWAGPALLYQKAAQALCAGELGRGADLLRKATEADRACHKSAPKQLELSTRSKVPAEEPAAIAEVQAGEGCAPTTAPAALAAASRIVAVGDTADVVPVWSVGKAHNWWELEIDEEAEEKARLAGESPSRRLREPAAKADLARRPDRPASAVAPAVASVSVQVAPASKEVSRESGLATADASVAKKRPRR